MANIIRESSIGLHTEKLNRIRKPKKRFCSRFPYKAHLHMKQFFFLILFVTISLFLFVYCRSIPDNGEGIFGNNRSVINHPEKVIKLSPDSSLPEMTPKLTQTKKLKGTPDFENLKAIQNLDYTGDSLHGIFWRESDFDGKVYLTFDDGPNMTALSQNNSLTVSESILDTLKKYHLKAVFFINGKNLEYKNKAEQLKLKETMLRVINEGHLLGNHSYHHDNLAKGKYIDGTDDLKETAEEFLSTQRALDALLGFHYPLILTRPPYAEPGRTKNLDLWLKQMRYYMISLQFDSYDYAYSENGKWNQQGILARVSTLLNENPSGGVILLHELESTSRLLPDLIQHVIQDNGYSVETMDSFLIKKYGRQS